jgi:hypothetical protein
MIEHPVNHRDEIIHDFKGAKSPGSIKHPGQNTNIKFVARD